MCKYIGHYRDVSAHTQLLIASWYEGGGVLVGQSTNDIEVGALPPISVTNKGSRLRLHLALAY